MRLPDPLYRAVKPLFVSHSRWHVARHPERADLRGPGTEFPDLLSVDRKGSGEQFLRFHREMIRVFRETAAEFSDTGFFYEPWPALPVWLVDFFQWSQPGFLEGALARTRELVRTGTGDDLGNFLESTRVTTHPFRGLHSMAHANVAAYEEHRFGSDHPALRDAAMDRSETAPHNEHFWGLHGWIDERYAELLERSPKPDRRRGVIHEPSTSARFGEGSRKTGP